MRSNTSPSTTAASPPSTTSAFASNAGEILGFLGPNGAGKTTTMRILTGYMPATDGKAIVAGYDVFTNPLEAKRRTGYLPETPPLYPDMTVREYLDFVARIKGVPPAERKTRVAAVMERTRVADMAERHCAKLSKGYKQRVGLAQALIHNPEVLILDEPTAGLDPKQIIETRELIREPRRRPHDRPQHAHPAGGRADLPARRHHQQRPRRRGRHAGEPDRAAATAAETMFVQLDAMGAEAGAGAGVDSRRHPRAGRRAGRAGSKSRASAAATSAARWRGRSSTAAGGCWSCARCA